MSFQDRLRYFRKIAGYKTGKEFAKEIDVVYQTYKGYENAGREPKYSTLCKIADKLNVSLDDLLGREIPRPMYTLTEIKNKVMGEVKKQKKQWGDEYHLTPHQWLGLIQEEVGEIAQAINETYLPNKTKAKLGGKSNIQAEIYQTAALLIRLSEKLEKEK